MVSDLPSGPAILKSHPSADWLCFGASPFYDTATLATGRARSDASPNYLGGECEIRIRTYVGFPGFLTRPTGVLDLQLSRRTDHVETWSPPYVCCSQCSRTIPKSDPRPADESLLEQATDRGGTT